MTSEGQDASLPNFYSLALRIGEQCEAEVLIL